MASHQITAPSRTLPPVPRGVIHMNVRHVAGFTIIGNHLAQHRGLSLVAIGLAAHIQSLPAGAKIGIKVLAARFPESETRIAAALRELEAAGYLRRSRERLPNGRIVTRTVSYNQPGATTPQSPARRSEPAPPRPVPPPPAETPQAPARVPLPAPTARRVTTPPLPQPQSSTPELHHRAATLLADLRRHAPQLVLSENDIRTLTPGIVTWLERGTTPDTLRHTLTNDLPTPLKHPAKLLRHRITALLPPPLPGTQELAQAERRSVIVIPLQNCDRCDRAFRSRHPGHCRDCRNDLQTAA